jgi:hypothetical protein
VCSSPTCLWKKSLEIKHDNFSNITKAQNLDFKRYENDQNNKNSFIISLLYSHKLKMKPKRVSSKMKIISIMSKTKLSEWKCLYRSEISNHYQNYQLWHRGNAICYMVVHIKLLKLPTITLTQSYNSICTTKVNT